MSGFWERVVASWWRGPVAFMAVYWGGAGVFMLLGRVRLGRDFLLGGERGAVLFLGMLLVWLAVAFLPPALVVAQLVRRQWRTALVTALLSAVALLPLIQVVLLVVLLGGGLAK